MTISKDPLVVIVEDSDEDFDTFTEAIRKSGLAVQVRRAPTGGDGIALLRASKDRPALVLMDLNTPGVDGREALTLMKMDASLRSIPVVVLSTSANPLDLHFCYDAGANAYHVKPVRYPDHLGLVIDLLTYWLCRAVIPEVQRGVA